MKEIVVIIEGGVVQNVIGVPEDCLVTVRDYDIDPVDTNARDADGTPVWEYRAVGEKC